MTTLTRAVAHQEQTHMLNYAAIGAVFPISLLDTAATREIQHETHLLEEQRPPFGNAKFYESFHAPKSTVARKAGSGYKKYYFVEHGYL